MTGGGSGGSGGAAGAAPGDRFTLEPFEPAGIDDVLEASFGGFGGVEWVVPTFALVVPGLLLIIAVLSQAFVSAAWLPFVRRWLGGSGERRRQRS